jgi:hypothetical protein
MLIVTCRSLIYINSPCNFGRPSATLGKQKGRLVKPPFAVDEMIHVSLHAVKRWFPVLRQTAPEAALEPPRFKFAAPLTDVRSLGFELTAFRSRNRRCDDHAQLHAHWDNGYQGNSREKPAVVGSAPSNQPSGRGHP